MIYLKLMKKKVTKKTKNEEVGTPPTDETKTEKQILLDLYEVLKARNIRSISDLENQIARCE